jgi:hypothetical protein
MQFYQLKRREFITILGGACAPMVVSFATDGLSHETEVDPPSTQTLVEPPSQTRSILGVTIGDTVATVKKVFGTDLNPEPYESKSGSTPQTILRLKSKGIRFFFESDKVKTIRLEPPFSTSVGGIHLGDTFTKLTQTRGKSIFQFDFGQDVAYLYPLDDGVRVRYDVNRNSNKVVTIFLFK